jgi:hypothetical protein
MVRLASPIRRVAVDANSSHWTHTLHADWTSIRFGKHRQSRRRMATSSSPANGTVSTRLLPQRFIEMFSTSTIKGWMWGDCSYKKKRG